jgi:FG-GAP-like repeat
VDGDGDDELLFSAAYLSVAYVVRGPVAATVDLATEADVRITTSGQQGDVSGIGDQDGDGLDDIVISDQGDDNARVMMFMGPLGDSLVTGDADASFADSTMATCIANSMSAAADTNGDGYADVVVGACAADRSTEYGAGGAFILTGPMSGTYDLVTDNIMILGEERLGGFGLAVSEAGDIDGDGFADVVIGAPYIGSSTDYVVDGPGATYVAFGPFAGTPLISEVGLRIDGTGDDQLGSSVAGIGDLDGDGFDDIATVGAGDDDGGADAGAIWIIPGAVLLR